MEKGRVLHNRGAAASKLRSPADLSLYRGSSSSFLSEDRRRLDGLIMSCIYGGAIPLRVLKPTGAPYILSEISRVASAVNT